MSKLKKALKDPWHALGVLKAIGLGYWYKLWYKITFKDVVIGKNFKVYGRLSIKGPGRVYIGDNCRIGMVVTPWTFHDEAVISIGDNVFLNGTRFACEDAIGIGDDVILADCRIMDTDFHGLDPNDRGNYNTAPIFIGNKVWLTIGVVVLKGVTIGDGCTVTPNSVVNANLTHNSIYGGNPAKLIGGVYS